MRKLTYVATKGNITKEVSTYEEMKALKAEGFRIEDKLTKIEEKVECPFGPVRKAMLGIA